MNPMLSWRTQLLETRLHRNAKYLALVLSTYMNEWGDSAFPGIPALVARSGMSKSTIERAMKELVGARWLLKKNRYREDGGQTSNTYIATHPEYGAPNRNGPSINMAQAPSQVGTHNSSSNSSSEVKSSCAPAAHTPDLMSGFDDWWEAYGKKVNRKGCAAKWKSAKLHTKAKRLIEDTQLRHKEDAQWRDGFQPHPLTYLNGERWEDEIAKTRANGNATHHNNNPRPESAHDRRKRINQEIRDRAMSHFPEVG